MRLILSALLLTLVLSAPAFAEDKNTARYVRALDNLNKINNYRPEQSPKHKRSKKIFSDRILDRTNRVVGEVDDVILDRNGAISMLDVEFNRLRIGNDSLMVNYDELGLRPVSNGYKMNYTDDQIVDLVPELLANIETASGDAADTYSLKKLIGRKVYSSDGRKLGEVEDVLFDSLGGRAELLFISMDYRSLRNETLAIPFSEPTYKGSKITVKKDFADAMIEYAGDN